MLAVQAFHGTWFMVWNSGVRGLPGEGSMELRGCSCSRGKACFVAVYAGCQGELLSGVVMKSNVLSIPGAVLAGRKGVTSGCMGRVGSFCSGISISGCMVVPGRVRLLLAIGGKASEAPSPAGSAVSGCVNSFGHFAGGRFSRGV